MIPPLVFHGGYKINSTAHYRRAQHPQLQVETTIRRALQSACGAPRQVVG